MATPVLVLNGPNLNLLGHRQPEIYGADTLDDIIAELVEYGGKFDVSIESFQTNSEGALIDRLHQARTEVSGVILNAGAFTHYSIALRDAISAVELPVVETHLSNVYSREEFRHRSVIAPVCIGVVSGFGRHSYILALHGLLAHLNQA